VLTHQSPFGVIGLIQAADPDLVLLDVNMPLLPGDDLAAFIKTDDRTRAVPIVLYSRPTRHCSGTRLSVTVCRATSARATSLTCA